MKPLRDESRFGRSFASRLLQVPSRTLMIVALVALLATGTVAAQLAEVQRSAVIDVDREIELDTFNFPRLDVEPREAEWATDMRPTWRAALRHHESDLRREVIDVIRQAHRLGMPGLSELAGELVGVMASENEQVVTRVTAAAALAELDCRDQASAMASAVGDSPVRLQREIEAALAAWQYEPIRATWMGRLDAPLADPELLRIAIEGLAKAGHGDAVAPLRRMLFSGDLASTMRLAVARGLADLGPPEVADWSERLLELSGGSDSFDSRFDALLGVELLAPRGADEPANRERIIDLLERYVGHSDGAVAAVGIRRLFELEPARVVAGSEATIGHRDANVRRVTIEALSGDGSESSIAILARGLADPVPGLRREARRGLLRHATDRSLRDEVVTRALGPFEAEAWQGIEQAIIVLTQLRERRINRRLATLVDHSRPEVQIAAAWGIKHLYERDEAGIVLRIANRVTAEFDRPGAAPHRSTVQAHLFEALGLLRYRPAIDLLNRLVPKFSSGYSQPRAAAIWGLGFLLDPERDEEIIDSLVVRLADAGSEPPEEPEVRAASAIALGRIAAANTLEPLRDWYRRETVQSRVGRSCGWAIAEMTGEPMDEYRPQEPELRNWPLRPTQAGG